jgi:hypothetical protein
LRQFEVAVEKRCQFVALLGPLVQLTQARLQQQAIARFTVVQSKLFGNFIRHFL